MAKVDPYGEMSRSFCVTNTARIQNLDFQRSAQGPFGYFSPLQEANRQAGKSKKTPKRHHQHFIVVWRSLSVRRSHAP